MSSFPLSQSFVIDVKKTPHKGISLDGPESIQSDERRRFAHLFEIIQRKSKDNSSH